MADLPGVGRNLQDHLEIYVQHACLQPITLYPVMNPLRQLLVGMQWTFFGTGPGATNHFEAGGFIRSRAGVEHPDLQYHFLPMAVSYDGSSAVKGHGFQAHVGPMRPTSVGRLRLRSADPAQAPAILFNYMQTEADRQEMRAAIRLTREIFAQKAFEPYRGPEVAPGPGVTSDADIDAFIRAKGESAYHPSCTCKMGQRPMAVADGGPGARRGGPARGRCLDHAQRGQRQPQRADHHDGREAGRCDPRAHATGTSGSPPFVVHPHFQKRTALTRRQPRGFSGHQRLRHLQDRHRAVELAHRRADARGARGSPSASRRMASSPRPPA